ncbi:hypothetical protein GCM10028856_28610 [Halopiger thermotolerans]
MGIILLFGLVAIGAVLVFGIGSVAIDSTEMQISAEQSEQMMQQFDKDLQTAMIDNGTSGAVYLREEGEYEIATEGQITVTAVNSYAEKNATIDLGTLKYEDESGNLFAHQAGGVWQGQGENTKLVSRPNIKYHERPNNTGIVELDVTNLGGNIEGGENRVSSRPVPSSQHGDLTQDIGFVNHINITVSDTPYHNGWARFLKDEFDASSGANCGTNGHVNSATVCHDESANAVTVIAPIEGEDGFTTHVGITPTIYGGLYVGDDHLFAKSMTVDRYNGSVGWTPGSHTEDLFVTDGDLSLPGANVTGVPVVNGRLSGSAGTTTSSIAFATNPDGRRIDVVNGTEVYNVTGTTPPSVFGAKMADSFDGIDDIDQHVDRAHTLVDEYENTTRGVPGTLTSNPSEDGFYYSSGTVDTINTIDTTDGDVRVAVDGDLELDTVNVVGSGRVTFYVSGDITAEDVTVSGDQADNLWIYGTSNADVDLKGKFQGVVYAPSSDLHVKSNAEVYGAVVGGQANIGNNVEIHFDKTLRTDIPIPKQNRDVRVQYSETRPPIDVVFVLDRSGSMGGCHWFFGCSGSDPHGLRVDATRNFIGQLNSTDRAGAVEFDTDADRLHGPGLDSNFNAVNQSLEANAGGGTYMAAGIEKGRSLYDSNSASKKKVMILLTDGKNDVSGKSKHVLDQETKDEAREAANKDITIYTVGLGSNVDESLLKEIANKTGGNYSHVDNAGDLTDIFDKLAADVTASSPKSFEVAFDDISATSPREYAVSVREQAVTIGNG